MTPGSGRLVGYVEAILAAVLWGSSGIFSVHLFRMDVSPQAIAILRPALGVAALTVLLGAGGWVAGPRGRGARPALGARGLAVLILGGGFSVGVFQIAYQMSIDAVGVPSTVAMVYLAPAVVVAVSGPLLGEWPTAARAALALITLLGVWLSVLGADAVTPRFGGPGVAWGVLAGLSYAGYTLFGRYATPRFGSGPTVLWCTAGACVWLAVGLPVLVGPVEVPRAGAAWMVLAAFALVSVAGAQFLFFDALGRIEAGRASIAAAAEPAVAALLATAMLGQGLNPVGWTGVLLVVAGVVGVGLSRPRPPEITLERT